MKIMYISIIHSQITGTMLHHYKVHLMSRLGKFKSEANASQHVAQVKRVIASSLCNGSLDDLLNVEEASTMWVADQKAEKKAEGTVASYCHSVAGFFNFFTTGKLKNVLSNYLGIESLQQQAQDWRKIAASLAKEGKVRQVELTERGYSKNVYIKHYLNFTDDKPIHVSDSADT